MRRSLWGILVLAAVAVAAAFAFFQSHTGTASPVVGSFHSTRYTLYRASGHRMRYLMTLPRGWTPRRHWPVLVALAGAGDDWDACLGGFSARAELPFIRVVPCTLSNADEPDPGRLPYPPEFATWGLDYRRGFDEQGILAILDDLHRTRGADGTCFLAAHSGGGNPGWRMLFGHPDRINAAAFGCANFVSTGLVAASDTPRDVPVRYFQGAQDRYMERLMYQWSLARAACERYGFKNVTRTVLPGVGHEPCIEQSLHFFAAELAHPTRRRALPVEYIRHTLHAASHHRMRYLMNLPPGWTPRRHWPVLVALGGSGCDWEAHLRSFSARPELPFIRVVPCTLSNADRPEPGKIPYPPEFARWNLDRRRWFDEHGILAILDDLRRTRGADGTCYLAAFSGGGNPGWRMVFGHPDRINAAAFGCANFVSTGPVTAVGRLRDVPVRYFQGADDPYMSRLVYQWSLARAECLRYDFKNVTRVVLPGLGHDPCVDQSLQFLAVEMEHAAARRARPMGGRVVLP